MNTFDKIKLTLRNGTGKCVVVHNEEPKYVVMTWEEYDKLEKMMEKLKKGGDFSDVDIKDIPV